MRGRMVECMHRDDDTSIARGFELDPLTFVGSGLGLLTIFVALLVFASFSNQAWMIYVACGSLLLVIGIIALGVRNIFDLRGDVVVISPEGILDRRVSDQTIPWSAITDIHMHSYRGLKSMIVTVDPVFDASFRTKMPRSRLLEGTFGIKGIMISASGLLHVSHEELLATAEAYAEVAKARQTVLKQTQT